MLPLPLQLALALPLQHHELEHRLEFEDQDQQPPTTSTPTTSVPTTSVLTTSIPTTSTPTTSVSTTSVPTTSVPTTSTPTTSTSITSVPTTSVPTTSVPTACSQQSYQLGFFTHEPLAIRAIPAIQTIHDSSSDADTLVDEGLISPLDTEAEDVATRDTPRKKNKNVKPKSPERPPRSQAPSTLQAHSASTQRTRSLKVVRFKTAPRRSQRLKTSNLR